MNFEEDYFVENLKNITKNLSYKDIRYLNEYLKDEIQNNSLYIEELTELDRILYLIDISYENQENYFNDFLNDENKIKLLDLYEFYNSFIKTKSFENLLKNLRKIYREETLRKTIY